MFITIKRHNHIVEHKDKTINDYLAKITRLEKELGEAKDFKALIERMAQPVNLVGGGYITASSYDPLSSDHEISISIKDNVATLVNDELSKDLIIKQKSTKVVFLNKNGGIEKTGFTKQKPDKGYSYKLIRN